MKTIRERLTALLKTAVESSKIPKSYHGVIFQQAENFVLKSATDDEIRNILVELRDKIIPWLLEGDK